MIERVVGHLGAPRRRRGRAVARATGPTRSSSAYPDGRCAGVGCTTPSSPSRSTPPAPSASRPTRPASTSVPRRQRRRAHRPRRRRPRRLPRARRRARRTIAPDAGRRPVALRRGPDRRRRPGRCVRREAARGRGADQLDQRRHLRARAVGARPDRRRPAGLDRAGDVPGAWSPTAALFAMPTAASTGSTPARPSVPAGAARPHRRRRAVPPGASMDAVHRRRDGRSDRRTCSRSTLGRDAARSVDRRRGRRARPSMRGASVVGHDARVRRTRSSALGSPVGAGAVGSTTARVSVTARRSTAGAAPRRRAACPSRHREGARHRRRRLHRVDARRPAPGRGPRRRRRSTTCRPARSPTWPTPAPTAPPADLPPARHPAAGRRRPDRPPHARGRLPPRGPGRRAVSVARPAFDAEVNVIGRLNVLEGARPAGAGKVVFASSGGTIYGEPRAERAAGQRVAPAASRSRRTASPRRRSATTCTPTASCTASSSRALALANVYGPRQDPHGEAGVVAIFAGQLLAASRARLRRRRADPRLRVRRRRRRRLRAGRRPRAAACCCNIGTGVETSVNMQLYETMAKRGGRHGAAASGPRPRRRARSAPRSIPAGPRSTSAGSRGPRSTTASAPSSTPRPDVR